MFDLTPEERDIIVRTVLGEAAGESPEGRAAVIHVILNRARSDRFPGTPAEVATQGSDGRFAQFSAWNDAGSGGNSIPRTATPDDPSYREVDALLGQVLAGDIPDPTGGAVHYYSPAGMPGGRQPYWWEDEMERQRGGVTEIGTHRFISPAGTPAPQARGEAAAPEASAPEAAAPEREGIMGAIQERAEGVREAFAPTPEGEPQPGFFGRLDQGLGALFGSGESGPSAADPDSVERLREALRSGDISQDTYEQMYAQLLMDDGDDGGYGRGLMDIGEYLQSTYDPPRFIGTSLPTSPLRGSSGSGTSAIQRLGGRPLA